MERHRTILRSKLNLVSTTVVSGIILETPEDDAFPAGRGNFVNITTGSQLYQASKGCVSNSCQIHYPFVDLKEFKSEHMRKRLKQILKLPPDEDKSSSLFFALLTQRGIGTNHEHGNQDRSMLLHPFHAVHDEDKKSVVSSTATDFLLCLLDGHGSDGNTVAQTAMNDLPISLTKELKKAMTMTGADMTQLHQVMTQVMINTFHRVDRHVNGNSEVAIGPMSGTTMTVALKLGDHLHVANVGDSQTFVVIYDTTTTLADSTKDGIISILYATRPDKPDLPDERQRILDNGGSLWLPPPTARGGQAPPRVYLEGLTDPVTNETRNYVLGLSRSIGDTAAHDTAGVVADPMVASLQVSAFSDNPNKQMFIFSASDGLLQKMAPLGIAERLAASLFRTDTVSPLETIEGILLDANEAWSKSRSVENNELKANRDDMTLAVIKVLP
jgi:serine/threonine protein phosphatase PrpC